MKGSVAIVGSSVPRLPEIMNVAIMLLPLSFQPLNMKATPWLGGATDPDHGDVRVAIVRVITPPERTMRQRALSPHRRGRDNWPAAATRSKLAAGGGDPISLRSGAPPHALDSANISAAWL